MSASILLSLAAAAATQELAPIPVDLVNMAAVSCVELDDDGRVTGAFIIHSTGDAARDAEVIAWVKQLRWNKAKPGEKRNIWFPMPVSFGNVAAIPMPPFCSPAQKPK